MVTSSSQIFVKQTLFFMFSVVSMIQTSYTLMDVLILFAIKKLSTASFSLKTLRLLKTVFRRYRNRLLQVVTRTLKSFTIFFLDIKMHSWKESLAVQ